MWKSKNELTLRNVQDFKMELFPLEKLIPDWKDEDVIKWDKLINESEYIPVEIKKVNIEKDEDVIEFYLLNFEISLSKEILKERSYLISLIFLLYDNPEKQIYKTSNFQEILLYDELFLTRLTFLSGSSKDVILYSVMIYKSASSVGGEIITYGNYNWNKSLDQILFDRKNISYDCCCKTEPNIKINEMKISDYCKEIPDLIFLKTVHVSSPLPKTLIKLHVNTNGVDLPSNVKYMNCSQYEEFDNKGLTDLYCFRIADNAKLPENLRTLFVCNLRSGDLQYNDKLELIYCTRTMEGNIPISIKGLKFPYMSGGIYNQFNNLIYLELIDVDLNQLPPNLKVLKLNSTNQHDFSILSVECLKVHINEKKDLIPPKQVKYLTSNRKITFTPESLIYFSFRSDEDYDVDVRYFKNYNATRIKDF